MNEKINSQTLIVAFVLIVAGTLSPSQGLDDSVNKTPLELITTMFVVVSIGVMVHFTWNFVEKSQRLSRSNYKSIK